MFLLFVEMETSKLVKSKSFMDSVIAWLQLDSVPRWLLDSGPGSATY